MMAESQPLSATLRDWAGRRDDDGARCARAAADRIDELEVALRDIIEVPPLDEDGGAYEMKRIARGALASSDG
jgi:hypothetical protein